MRITVPNQITLGRLVLALVFFALLSTISPRLDSGDRFALGVAFWMFLVAALSDVLDGWLARAWNQVTQFGRVVDPVVDKVLVCGAFVYFASGLFVDAQSGTNRTGVQAWMVVLIILRELLVSAVRASAESGGVAFGADWSGKLKMLVQSVTVCVILGQLAWFPQLAWLSAACVWMTVAVTAGSLLTYLQRGRQFMFSREALSADTHAARESPEAARRATPVAAISPSKPPAFPAGIDAASKGASA